MYDYDDTLSESDLLALMDSMDGGHLATNALGQDIAMPSDHVWLMDLIEADRRLKAMAQASHRLDSERLIQPDAFGSEVVTLASNPLLETLTTVYTVLVTLFHETEIGQHYRPSPYATRFLWAFASCAYLHEAGFHRPPTMSREGAEQTVMELNQRLGAWYQSLKQSDFAYECGRNRRNSQKNYQRLRYLIDALIACYASLQVVRVDLSYGELDSPWITYDTARHHREQLCRLFHTHGLFDHLVGYAWKLEWQPKKGFHYHWLFFFDGHQVREGISLAQQIGELWAQSITGGQGIYRNFNRNAENVYRYNALGKVHYHDTVKMQGLDFLAHYLTKGDEYAAMVVQGRTFQTSHAPEVPEGPRPGRPRQYPCTAFGAR
ncbi:inovirus-type Gp2 protein [Halomonas sp. NO4]|uniref:YagK/YfjJ domain-containing protein n=1 Tax=Halomonas sp. NO4 TaxID=2484813 RepID=UPI0013D344C8|nr:inovirus-type Gp2 protein [Halomonas sp. NO4]